MTTSDDPFTAEYEKLEQYTALAELYTASLSRSLPALLPLEALTDRQYVYRELRAAVQALTAFGNAVDQYIGRDVCRELFPGFDLWFGPPGVPGQLQVLMETTCDCCGQRFRVSDPLGRECFVVGQFTQACAHCYELLKTSYPGTSRRLARLKAFAQAHPQRLATRIVAKIEQRGTTVEQVEHELRINELAFLQLIILPREIIFDWEAGTAFVAKMTNCSLASLRSLLPEDPAVQDRATDAM